MNRAFAFGLISSLGLATGTLAQVVTVNLSRPTLDRWMYGAAPNANGSESTASTFGAILAPGFDDRDGQVLLGFDTSSLVTPGLPLDRYRVSTIEICAAVSVNNQAYYDPTFDSVSSLYSLTDSDHTTDADLGRPVELFAVGYRAGFTATTIQENSPFSAVVFDPTAPNLEGVRNAYAATIDDAGNTTDVSRQVRQRFDAQPLSIGLTNEVAPGNLMPQGTVLTFRVDLCSAGARRYVQRGLQQGRLLFIISTLEPASGGPGGGTGAPTYPKFYTKENPTAIALGLESKLNFTTNLGRIADVNGDEGVTIDDLLQYLDAYFAGTVEADVDNDCGVTIDDLLVYLEAFGNG